jgi:Fucose 4-O-acetylase and related acetyltransferases
MIDTAKQSRIEWIDSAMGIGILCVVLAHIYVNGYITDFIYLFHMPLFFFIGGYLYKPTDDYKGYFVKKVKHLLVPYFVFLAIFQFGEMLTPSYNDKIYTHICNSIYGGRLLSGWTGVF